MPLAAYGEGLVLDAIISATFISLHTADPGRNGLHEITEEAYVRVAANFIKSTNTNPTVASNSNLLQWPQCPVDWGTVTHFGIWNTLEDGNLVAYDAVAEPRKLLMGDIARWDAGAFKIKVDLIRALQ